MGYDDPIPKVTPEERERNLKKSVANAKPKPTRPDGQAAGEHEAGQRTRCRERRSQSPRRTPRQAIRGMRRVNRRNWGFPTGSLPISGLLTSSINGSASARMPRQPSPNSNASLAAPHG